ncbi:MAG: hypothetical protein V1755_15360 [Chloroflexota bacterium]
MLPTKPDPVRNPLLIIQIVLIGMLFVALTLSAIAERDAPASAPTANVNAIKTQASLTAWANPTRTAEASTPAAEYTPTPSATATPSPTPTQPPEPILRTGTGDSVFHPQKWIGPAVVRITYDGRGPFLVWTQNENGKRELMLANSLGAYHGSSLIDFQGPQRTLRIEVRTAEAWHIELLPLSAARREHIPGAIRGTGDEVVLLDGSQAPDLLTADASTAWGNFSVWAYGNPSHLVINAVAPYTGALPLPPGTTALAVKAIGPWSLQLTAR